MSKDNVFFCSKRKKNLLKKLISFSYLLDFQLLFILFRYIAAHLIFIDKTKLEIY